MGPSDPLGGSRYHNQQARFIGAIWPRRVQVQGSDDPQFLHYWGAPVIGVDRQGKPPKLGQERLPAARHVISMPGRMIGWLSSLRCSGAVMSASPSWILASSRAIRQRRSRAMPRNSARTRASAVCRRTQRVYKTEKSITLLLSSWSVPSKSPNPTDRKSAGGHPSLGWNSIVKAAANSAISCN